MCTNQTYWSLSNLLFVNVRALLLNEILIDLLDREV